MHGLKAALKGCFTWAFITVKHLFEVLWSPTKYLQDCISFNQARNEETEFFLSNSISCYGILQNVGKGEKNSMNTSAILLTFEKIPLCNSSINYANIFSGGISFSPHGVQACAWDIAVIVNRPYIWQCCNYFHVSWVSLGSWRKSIKRFDGCSSLVDSLPVS